MNGRHTPMSHKALLRAAIVAVVLLAMAALAVGWIT